MRSLDVAPADVVPPVEPLLGHAGGTAGNPEPPAVGRSALLISDFTIDPLEHHLRSAGWSATVAPYGAVVPTLLGTPAERHDVAVVWTRAESTLSSFARAVELDDVSSAEIERDVDAFADIVLRAADAYRLTIVPTWTIESYRRGRGLVDARTGGIAWALSIANVRLMQRLAESGQVFALDTQRWVGSDEPEHEARRWYLGKIPFDDLVFRRAATEIVAAAATVEGATRKLIVLDLDNTVWGGVVGDDGWESLRLGGHDATGEAFVDFQSALLRLQRRGVLLAIASKNEESVAIEALEHHPEMVLRPDHFVAWRIDWNDKAANIAAMVSELNLGLQSVVFIDDNPAERGRVREALPEVFVPEWPQDPTAYVPALARLTCFDTVNVSDEDRERTAMYAAERQRSSLHAEVGSIDDWLRALGVLVTFDPVGVTNLPARRAVAEQDEPDESADPPLHPGRARRVGSKSRQPDLVHLRGRPVRRCGPHRGVEHSQRRRPVRDRRLRAQLSGLRTRCGTHDAERRRAPCDLGWFEPA